MEHWDGGINKYAFWTGGLPNKLLIFVGIQQYTKQPSVASKVLACWKYYSGFVGTSVASKGLACWQYYCLLGFVGTRQSMQSRGLSTCLDHCPCHHSLFFCISGFQNSSTQLFCVVLQENLCILKCDIYLSPCQIPQDLRMQFRGVSCVAGETHKFGHRATKPWNILKSAAAPHKLVKHSLMQCTARNPGRVQCFKQNGS